MSASDDLNVCYKLDLRAERCELFVTEYCFLYVNDAYYS